MVFITAEVLAENCICTIRRQKKGKESVLRIRIKDLGEKLNIKNIFDSVDKEIKGKFKNCPTKEQIKKYKKYGSKLIEGIKILKIK